MERRHTTQLGFYRYLVLSWTKVSLWSASYHACTPHARMNDYGWITSHNCLTHWSSTLWSEYSKALWLRLTVIGVFGSSFAPASVLYLFRFRDPAKKKCTYHQSKLAKMDH